MYNFKNIHNVQDFFNEVGANIELSLSNKSNEGLIVLTNEFGESDEFLNFNELNKYANDYLQNLKK